MLVGEDEEHGVGEDLVAGEGVLGDDLVFVFDFHGDGGIREDGSGLGEDGGHFPGFDAVLVVLADPDLELAGVGFPEGAAAVEEGFVEVADFGDVERLGDGGTAGQAEAEGEVGVVAEKRGEVVECHDRRDLGPGQQLSARWARRWLARMVSWWWSELSEAAKKDSRVRMSGWW